MNQAEINNLLLRANALVKTNWLHAVHILEQAASDHPGHPQILQNLGDIFMQRQLYEKALAFYQDALKFNPADSYLLFLIGNCYFALGDYRLANSYFNQIADPQPEVLYNKALALAFLGQHQESITVIRQILTVLTDNPFIYFLLIEQYMRTSNYDEAIQSIRKAERKFGKHNQLLLFNAIIHARKGIWLTSYHSFQEYEKVLPLNNADHLSTYALTAKKLGLIDNSIALLIRARTLDPYLSSIHEELIRLQLHKKDLEGARKSMTIAQRYISRSTPILRLLKERINSGDI
ncbi:MAG: tetratricopeptide repeat protein [Candidatus Cloacimonetes bacterium]|nr:tetratricopeptide repeat protein [Candidatus Cloacimonadota bacterium]